MERGGSRMERGDRGPGPRVERGEQRPSAAGPEPSERRSIERERAREDRTGQRRAQQQDERRRERAGRSDRDNKGTERRQVERKEAEQRQRERPERVERQREQREDRAERRDRREDRADRRDRREDRADRRERQEDRDRRADRGDRSERREAAREARQRLSQEQRTRFHRSFDRQHVANVDIRVRIGTHIPRRVRLYPIPAMVVSLVPAYRYYRYVYIDDTICIVDPDTYEIVDVIEYGPGGPAIIEARLELTDRERALILDSIAVDFPEAEVDLGLALGADVPRAVELHRFPPVVLDRVSKLRAYRFAVSGGDVVIIDPDDREIALVVRR